MKLIYKPKQTVRRITAAERDIIIESLRYYQENVLTGFNTDDIDILIIDILNGGQRPAIVHTFQPFSTEEY